MKVEPDYMFPIPEFGLWDEGGVAVVHVRSLMDTDHEELQPGGPMKAYVKGAPKSGTFICKSHDRQLLDQMQQKMKAEAEGAPSAEVEQEPGDFSASASSWAPSDDQASESDEVEEKKIKLEHSRKEYNNDRPRKRILTPSHRANAVIPEAMQRGNKSAKKSGNRKRTYESMKQKSLPDSTKKNSQCEVTLQNVTVDLNDILGIRDCFRELFQMVQDMKSLRSEPRKVPIKPDLTNTVTNMSTVSDDEKENDRSRSPESDRSEDNILISNKYEQYNGDNRSKNSPQAANQMKPTARREWIPIGSGKTLLHKDKFNKVNWKSYTIATRTLLLALFPRRILATHSLTGKRSPAFQNKPAKMCLDPKIISDVIMEIQDRFGVRENLIRSIITTKCADECKMFKMRQEKRKTTSTVKTQENENIDEDRNNRTA